MSQQVCTRCCSKNELKKASVRLETFLSNGWPMQSSSDSQILAEAGFYYTHLNNEVICVFCDVKYTPSSPSEVPILEHKKLNKYCPFIIGYDVKNVPISEDPVRGPNTVLPCYDICGTRDPYSIRLTNTKQNIVRRLYNYFK